MHGDDAEAAGGAEVAGGPAVVAGGAAVADVDGRRLAAVATALAGVPLVGVRVRVPLCAVERAGDLVEGADVWPAVEPESARLTLVGETRSPGRGPSVDGPAARRGCAPSSADDDVLTAHAADGAVHTLAGVCAACEVRTIDDPLHPLRAGIAITVTPARATAAAAADAALRLDGRKRCLLCRPWLGAAMSNSYCP